MGDTSQFSASAPPARRRITRHAVPRFQHQTSPSRQSATNFARVQRRGWSHGVSVGYSRNEGASVHFGFVAFYQQWTDATQSDANISEEGSILFKAAGPTTTQVRVMLTGGWQRLEVTGGGKHSTDLGMVGGVQQLAGADEYKKLLVLLETGLASATK